ncbi:MAG TPA: hypothetical protein VM010_06730 [Chitinophagaceae bacterium]|nr:hypothetical protein [Chitinophagaceae bacterium]
MRRGLYVLIWVISLAGCSESGTTISVNKDSLANELDTLGQHIEEKAAVAGDSVKAKYNDIKERVTARIDSIEENSRD